MFVVFIQLRTFGSASVCLVPCHLLSSQVELVLDASLGSGHPAHTTVKGYWKRHPFKINFKRSKKSNFSKKTWIYPICKMAVFWCQNVLNQNIRRAHIRKHFPKSSSYKNFPRPCTVGFIVVTGTPFYRGWVKHGDRDEENGLTNNLVTTGSDWMDSLP